MMDSTATGWYYALHGERVGPRSLEEVRSLVANGVLDGDALVWTPGMREWARVGDFPILAPGWTPPHSSPAPRAEAEWVPEQAAAAPATAHDTAPHPGRRAAARLADILLYLILVSAVAGIVVPDLATRMPSDPRQVDLSVNVMATVALGVMVVLFEGLLLHFTGTTPGKSLFGVRVVGADGARLSLGQAFTRTLRVWIFGMGAGLLLFAIIAMIASYIRLNARGATHWDEQMGVRVEHPAVTAAHALKMVGYVLAFIFMLVILISAFVPVPDDAPPPGTPPAAPSSPAGVKLSARAPHDA